MPPADSPTAVKMSVSLSTGDEPVPVPRPLPNADDLHQALRASWGAVVECYTRELAARPNAGGRMELRFSLHPSDDVVDVAEGDTHFDDPDVTRCVVGVYRATPLPLAQMKRPADFVYALHFESKPEP